MVNECDLGAMGLRVIAFKYFRALWTSFKREGYARENKSVVLQVQHGIAMCRVAGPIPGLAQWVIDPALP